MEQLITNNWIIGTPILAILIYHFIHRLTRSSISGVLMVLLLGFANRISLNSQPDLLYPMLCLTAIMGMIIIVVETLIGFFYLKKGIGGLLLKAFISTLMIMFLTAFLIGGAISSYGHF